MPCAAPDRQGASPGHAAVSLEIPERKIDPHGASGDIAPDRDAVENPAIVVEKHLGLRYRHAP
jgi:hypothetical protein